jgi:predicted DNA-binding transcriptional regulator AlpA
MSNKKYLRTAGVAERYSIDERSVPRWVADGRLPRPMYRGRIPLWAEDELDALDRAATANSRRRVAQ